MNVIDFIRVALAAILANKLRSALTTLGIVIGVAAVIVMVAIGLGARSEVDRQINSLGSNMLVVFPGSSRVGGRSGGAGTDLPLGEADVESIRAKIPSVIAISGQLNGSAPVVFGNRNWTSTISGVHQDYATVRDWTIVAGRDFGAADMRTSGRVAIIGQTIVKQLFDGSDPIGQVLRIRNTPFQVIGLLEAKGQSTMGRDQDDIVLLPIAAARGKIVGRSQVQTEQVGQINVKFEDGTDLDGAQVEIEQLLRQRRRIAVGAEDNFSVRNIAEFLKARTAALTTLGWLLAATSAIALVVGGIGIMNIMLVSVTERTREIGLRMAVGARRHDIMMQFLVEAVTLCVLGGLIGVVLGVGSAYAMGAAANWPILISPETILLALAAAAGTGVFFGFFPARRAAHLNPIDALRSE
ncbi:MAG: ABC transporter permease [Hyphomicrobiaceae bacterium]